MRAGSAGSGAALGDDPRALLWLATPTLVACAIDLAVRPGSLASFGLQGKAIYGSSLLVSAAWWTLPLLVAAKLAHDGRRAALGALLALGILPMAAMGFAGQLVYHRVFGSYMGRDTLRLGIALRGTVLDWLSAWGGPWLLAGIVAAGGALTWALALVVQGLARRASADGSRSRPPPSSGGRSSASGRTTSTAASCKRRRRTRASCTASCTRSGWPVRDGGANVTASRCAGLARCPRSRAAARARRTSSSS